MCWMEVLLFFSGFLPWIWQVSPSSSRWGTGGAEELIGLSISIMSFRFGFNREAPTIHWRMMEELSRYTNLTADFVIFLLMTPSRRSRPSNRLLVAISLKCQVNKLPKQSLMRRLLSANTWIHLTIISNVVVMATNWTACPCIWMQEINMWSEHTHWRDTGGDQ